MSSEIPEPVDHQPGEIPPAPPEPTPFAPPPISDQDEVKKKNRKERWLGVGLFLLLNVIIFPAFGVLTSLALGAITSTAGSDSIIQGLVSIVYVIMNFIPFVVNIGLMIYFVVRNRPQVALGMLITFGVILAIVVCLGVIFTAACFIILSNSSGSL